MASGGAALVLQLAWMREFRLVFGGTTAATAAVLAIFMAGLGVGSAVLGKRADRSPQPLLLYGSLEIGVALSAAATPWLIRAVSVLYYGLGGQQSLGLTGATAVRLALATAVMAVPTFLMGGTLPAATRAVTTATDMHRRALAVLYGANAIGAVFGTAAATFYALEHLGTKATLWAACAASLLVGAVAVAWSRAFGPLDRSHSTMARRAAAGGNVFAEVSEPAELLLGGRRRFIYLTAAVLGFTFFALEIVWYRMLAPILGGTAFTFGLILCVALAGIGIGGAAYHVVFRRLRPSWPVLAVTCGCEAALTVLPFAMGDRVALFAARQSASAASFVDVVVGWTYVAGIVVLPVALVSGLQFPLLIGLLGQGRESVSKHLGLAYAWNTVGAIAGSLAAGFGALPLLGAPALWQAIGVALALLSATILALAPRINHRAQAAVAILAVASVGLTFAQGPSAVWRHSGIGAGRAALPDESSGPNELRDWVHMQRRGLIWEADGIESSIGIVGGDGTQFMVNGKSDGNSLGDASTQMGLAIVGGMLHPNPQTALVIGLGTGESAGWLAEMRSIQRVDVVEIEPAVDRMSESCRELNHDVLNHQRVRRVYSDGREFVLTTNDKYDLVVSEPSNPYRAGTAALYTAEFFEAVRDRLNPGGILVQWLQAYEIDDETVAIVLATLRSAFRHVEVWQSAADDLLLVCSDTVADYSAEELRERLENGTIQDALQKAWNVADAEGFLAHFVANSQWAEEIAAQPFVELNTDDRTALEYGFGKAVGRGRNFLIEATRDRLSRVGFHRPSLRGEKVDWDLIELRRQEMNLVEGGQFSLAQLPRPEDRALVEALARFRDHDDFAGAVAVWPAEHRPPSSDVARLVLARCLAELARPECLELVAAAEARYPADAAAVRAIFYRRAGDTPQATEALEQFYLQLADSPWLIPVISTAAISHSIDVAKGNRTAAERLYPRLSQPFASRRFEQLRLLARIMVARELGSDEVVEALAELEPYVIWTAEVLEPRATAYAAVNHPLARRAERDWEWFQRHQ